MIGLMDCNNFFVSCERLFRPDLVGKPVVVLSSNDGCIVARSQEVKDMGVPMGLPLFQAKQLVDMSKVTLFSSNFQLYRDMSSRVMAALTVEVGACEVYSIDEAFFILPATVTNADLLQIRARVMQDTGIPVSIGCAATKTLAKVGSKLAKKADGVMVLSDETWRAVAQTYPVEGVWNLGRATARKLSGAGITTAAAFMIQDPAWVDRQYGIMGRRLQDELKGICVYDVGNDDHKLHQSLASTRSFAKSTNDRSALWSAISYHLTHVAEKLRQKKLAASWLTIELRASRHSDFAYRSGSTVVELVSPTNSTATLLTRALEGASSLYEVGVPYKKAGVVAGGLVPESFIQPNLFGEMPQSTAQKTIDTVIDTLNYRFGAGTLRPGTGLDNRPKTNSTLCSPGYTTVWKDIPTILAK